MNELIKTNQSHFLKQQTMKHVLSIPVVVLTSILCFACSDDTEQMLTKSHNKVTFLKSGVATIDNPANPFDAIGQSYRDYLDTYKSGAYSPQSYSDVCTIVNMLSAGQTVDNSLETELLLAACVSTPISTTSALLQASGLSDKVKTVLYDFILDYDRLAQQSFSEAYNDIVLLEGSVLSSTVLSTNEKRIIFSVTAMTRYSLYHSCCEDTDWEKSVGHIVAAMAGAMESNSQALKYSLITKIIGLEKIQL